MKILIIGGTIFLGRLVFTEAALAAGHDVTLFNRGQHNPGRLSPVLPRFKATAPRISVFWTGRGTQSLIPADTSSRRAGFGDGSQGSR